MEAQIEKLEALYKHFVIPEDKTEEYGDELTLEECWGFQDPTSVDFWSLVLVSHTNILGFISKYKNALVPLPLSSFE